MTIEPIWTFADVAIFLAIVGHAALFALRFAYDVVLWGVAGPPTVVARRPEDEP